VRRALDLLRRNPDYRRVYVATLVSSGGDWFALIPLLALLFELTGSGLYGGLVLAADTALFAVLSPYGGTLADRMDRKQLLVVTSAVSGLFSLLLLLVDGGTEWIGVLAIGGIALMKAIGTPAGSAATPNLVPVEDLGLATVMNAVSWGSMLAVGAALGGLLTALAGTTVCFLVDAASFGLSALLVARCSTPFQRPREVHDRPAFRTAVREAYDYARTDRAVLALLLAKPGIAFANGALVLFPLVADGVFHVGETGLGLLYAARGLGVLFGPILLGSRGRAGAATWWVLAGGTVACGSLYVAVAASPFFWLVLVLVTLAHLGGGTNWTVTTYGLQRRVPDAVLGRIMSADGMLVTLAIGVTQVAAGVLSDVVDTRVLVGCFGAASVAYGMAWFVGTRSLRDASVESGV
jgi:predicted MFS family arabinose efflux permease